MIRPQRLVAVAFGAHDPLRLKHTQAQVARLEALDLRLQALAADRRAGTASPDHHAEERRLREEHEALAEEIAPQTPAAASAAPAVIARNAPPDLDAREAATRLNALKSNGQPTDRFYSAIAPLVGRRDGRIWRFPPEKVEAFRQRGELA